jgi:hypothetical protein
VRPIGCVRRRELLDLPVDPLDEVVERRLGRPRHPELGLKTASRRRLLRGADVLAPEGGDDAAARRALQEAELQQVRLVDVLDRVGSSPSATASVESPTGPPSNFTRIAESSSRSIRSSPVPSTSSSSSASRATAFVITPS